ncbi:MAG: glycoside hydrolase family 127 protein, partial [Pirellulaceae bacterium]|nr:glycoside hydrolase family 127 protein [Pirellulaceae bacterium]
MPSIYKAAGLVGLTFVQLFALPMCLGLLNAQEAVPVLKRVSWPKLREVQWDDHSFWGQHQRVCRSSTLPAMTELMEGTEHSHFIENFRIAAGMKSGKHRGPDWNDGDTYKWLEALAAAYAVDPQPQLKQTMDEAIRIIAKAQRSDGYLHTPVLIAQKLDPSSSRALGDPSQFEMYNFGHLMTAACVHFESTGERQFLDVAIRATDFLHEQFAKPDSQLARHAICPAHYMGLIDLYRTTHDAKWLRLATHLMNMRDLVQGGDDNQDRLPLREQREAVGHAVRANYLYAGAADLMIETNDRSLWPALEACWSSVQSKKIYITGGCGALFDGASPDGSKQQSSITRIHQAYGRNDHLPNATAHNETCAAIGNVLWTQRLWQAQPEARYIDALETSLLNAVLAGVSLDGQRYFYTNTLRQLDTMPVELRWSRERKSWITCYCCPPNVARTIASMHRLAYAYDDQSLWLLLYGSNRLQVQLSDGSSLKVEQR